MSTDNLRLQFLRGTTSQNNAYTGADGELTIDTQKGLIRIHDGETEGGKQVGNHEDYGLGITRMSGDSYLSSSTVEDMGFDGGDIYESASEELGDYLLSLKTGFYGIQNAHNLVKGPNSAGTALVMRSNNASRMAILSFCRGATRPVTSTLTLFSRGQYSNAVERVQLYNQRNIVGEVSDDPAGISGAIIEEGENENGRYIKLADGTLLCYAIIREFIPFRESRNERGAEGRNVSARYYWTYPHTFANDGQEVHVDIKHLKPTLGTDNRCVGSWFISGAGNVNGEGSESRTRQFVFEFHNDVVAYEEDDEGEEYQSLGIEGYTAFAVGRWK